MQIQTQIIRPCVVIHVPNLTSAKMKIRDVIRMIEADGWYFARQKGDHRQYRHRAKKGCVTIAGHNSKDIHPKTLNSVLVQAGLRKR